MKHLFRILTVMAIAATAALSLASCGDDYKKNVNERLLIVDADFAGDTANYNIRWDDLHMMTTTFVVDVQRTSPVTVKINFETGERVSWRFVPAAGSTVATDGTIDGFYNIRPTEGIGNGTFFINVDGNTSGSARSSRFNMQLEETDSTGKVIGQLYHNFELNQK